MRPLTFRGRLERALQGPYVILGAALVAILILAAALGPELAPHNPFRVERLRWIDGELRKAPFPPDAIHPLGTDDLGRDQLSLLLSGARSTLVMAWVATTVRLVLGMGLGISAGWWPGSRFDRAVTALTDFLAAIPGLLLAILVVFAVGIQRGQTAFVVALSSVGWGEIAQIVRGQVLTIRNQLYILAARAVGLSAANIVSRHVLPNLLASFLALAALEMGAALLLLGELGFLQIFVGGGRTGFDTASWETRHYFDAPDWGAMLGTTWRWSRSYPWLPMVPALSFFVAVVSFNIFGYGLQRFIERGRFHPSGWSVLRVLLVTAVALVGARALLERAGLEAQLAQLVRQFDTIRANDDVVFLAQPALEGRYPGSPGAERAALYIAQQFQQAGLSPTTPDGSYFHPYAAIHGRVTAPPTLALMLPGAVPRTEPVGGVSLDPRQAFHGEGSTEGELVIMANTVGRLTQRGILLVLDPEEKLELPWNVPPPCSAILRLVPDDGLTRANVPPPIDRGRYPRVSDLPAFPNLLIGESAARGLLAEAGLELAALQKASREAERIDLPTGVQVRLDYSLIYEEVEGVNVVGYVAGLDRSSLGQRILLAATYTGRTPQGDTAYPGADENASGVAVMLETARLLGELDWIPKRTVAFAALGEGGGSHFVNYPPIPTERADSWTAVVIHGVGAGEPRLAREALGSGLDRAFDQSARRFGVRTRQHGDWPFFFVSNYSRLSQGELSIPVSYQGLVVTREGDELSGTSADTPAHLDASLLEGAGRAVAHFVTVLSAR